jgi:hypothetical protein
MASNTAFPLGIFVGGPNGSDASVMSTVVSQFNSFTSAMGTTAQYMNAYVDQAQSPYDWPTNASWTAWSWSQMPGTSGVTPIIGLPMANTWDAGHPDSAFRAFASGQYDSQLLGVVKSWADQGFTSQIWRPGYEMNIESMPWYVGTDKQTQSDYVSAFQHISSVLKAAGQTLGVDVKVVWSPNIQNWNGSTDVMSLYPGNQAVDIIGPDQYDNMYPRDLYDWSKNDGSYASSFQEWAANPVNVAHYFTYPSGNKWSPTGDGQGNGQSLQSFIDLAKANGKPIALSETGAGGGGSTDTFDDPAFVKWLSATLTNAGVPVTYVSIWDVNDNGPWDFSSASAGKPLTAAAWRQYFGAGSGSGTASSGAVTTPTDTTTPSSSTGFVVYLSEDAYQGNAQATISIDGTQVNGTTVTASHSSGQTQAVVLQGSYGSEAHKVSVGFTNDAYGGSGAGLDRNLFVDAVTFNGSSLSPSNGPLYSNGTLTFVKAASGSGSGNTLTLAMAEDAYQGDAQAEISIDGRVLGQVTITASNSGSPQSFTFTGSFGTGGHTVGVNFLNDAYGGAGADRNVYVKGITLDGTVHSDATASLYNGGLKTFSI